MNQSFLRMLILAAPLALTACGEGWEAQRTTEYTPYGNDRTAGSGVVYVRAQMLPKKELELEPELESVETEEVESPKAEVVEAKPVLEAEKIFVEAQGKGSAASKKNVSEEEEHGEIDFDEDAKDESFAALNAEAELAVDQEKKIENVKNRMSLRESSGQISRTLIESNMALPEVENAENSEAEHEGLEKDLTVPPAIRSDYSLEDPDEQARALEKAISPQAGNIITTEDVIVQPVKKIVVPKRDFSPLYSSGQETLNEIYNPLF